MIRTFGLLAYIIVVGLALLPLGSSSCPPLTDGTMGICVMECISDEQCGDGQECCSNGCGYTCQTSVPEPCPMPMCTTDCKFEYKYTEAGCMTCECMEDPCLNYACDAGQTCQLQTVQCVKAPCPPIPTCVDACPMVKCADSCPYGYVTTKEGCQTCECKPDPCFKYKCGPREKCYLEPVQCIRAPCPSVPVCKATVRSKLSALLKLMGSTED